MGLAGGGKSCPRVCSAEFAIFGGGGRVVGQDVDSLHPLAAGNKSTRGLNVFFIVIDPADEWDANSYGSAAVAECLEIAKDQLVANAGKALVDVAIYVFQIVEEDLGMAGDLQKSFRRSKAAGIHRPVNSQPAAGLEQGNQAFRLTERFAAGAGDAAVIVLEEDHFFLYFFDNLANLHTRTGCLMRQRRAGTKTGPAGSTPVFVANDSLVDGAQGIVRAEGDTFTATDTFFGKKKNFFRKVYPFRIMAPVAGKRTTFEKYGYTDVRAVVQGIAFNGKDMSSKFVHVIT